MGGSLEKARTLNEEVLHKSLEHFGHDHGSTKSAARALWRCLIAQDLLDQADKVQDDHGILLKTVEDNMRNEALAKHRPSH
ncbi:hypothetical protein N7528_008050 [Penicillium herquei]|nr:hypothetical protein N7528_008050 [Penicillium herquei]